MLNRLIEKFETRVDLPIDLEEISKAITELGFSDEIKFQGVDADSTQLRGAFYQYHYHRAMYAEPTWVTCIFYNQEEPVEMQRVICCKELMHIFDSKMERTDTMEEIPRFIDKLLGPLAADEYGQADYQAAKDKVALYQCLPLLFPKAALQEARQAVQKGRKTPEEIAKWAAIPLNIAEFMLDENWDNLNNSLPK